MGALLCGLVPGRTPLRGSAEHRPGSRGPHLRALRGSSVSTALSSGWNRKSSTYSPNFSKNHFCMRGHSPWPRRSAETAGVGEGEGRARGGGRLSGGGALEVDGLVESSQTSGLEGNPKDSSNESKSNSRPLFLDTDTETQGTGRAWRMLLLKWARSYLQRERSLKIYMCVCGSD